MKCTLIILNYMDKIRALNLAYTCNEFDCIDHIVIVDNCSPDDSFIWLTDHKNGEIEVIQTNSNKGFSCGNNYGARYVINKYNPQYILFANTDTIFEEHSIIKCLDELENHNDLGLISLRMMNIEGYEENSCWKEKNYLESILFCVWLYRRKKYKDFYYSFDNTNKKLEIVDVVRGSFMCFKSKALMDINYFDENTFLYYEEDIISKKLQKSNYKIGILTDEIYIHNHIQNKKYETKNTKNNLDKSMYYLLSTYYDIGPVKKFLARLVIFYSKIEFSLLSLLKK